MSKLNQPLLEGEQNLDKPSAPSSAIQAINPPPPLDNSCPEITFNNIRDSVDKAFKYNKLEFPFECKHIKISAKHHLLIGASNDKATIIVKHLDGSLKTREITTTFESISCIRLNKDENKIYLGTNNGKIAIYEFPSFNPETLNILDVGTSSIYFDVMSYEIYAYDVSDETLKIVDEKTQEKSIISDNPGGQYVRISPDDKFIAISTDEYVTVHSKDMKWKDFEYKIKKKNSEYDQYDYSYGRIQKKCEIEFCNVSDKIGISYLNYIEVWDLTKDKLEKTLKLNTESDITSFKFSEDDSLLAAVGIDHSINIWDLTSDSSLPKFLNQPVSDLDKEKPPLELPMFFDLEIDEKRNLLYTHALDSKFSFQWKGIFIDKVTYPDSTFDKTNQRCIVSKNQGHLLVTDVNSYKIQIWDIEKTDLIKTITLENAPKELSFGEENENFLYACTEGQIHIYNGQDYSFVKTITCDLIKEIYVLRTCTDFIIIGGQGAKVIVLDLQGNFVKDIPGYKETVSGMKVYKDLLITGDSLGNVYIHNIGTWGEFAVLAEHKNMIRTIEVFTNEDILVTVGHDKKCIFWSIYDKTCIKEKILDHEIDSCCLSKDERSLILSTNEGDINVYNLPGMELLMTLKYKAKMQRFAMDKNEKYLLVSNLNGIYRTLSPISLDNHLILDKSIDIPNLRKFLNNKKIYSSNDTWIIAPYMVNSLHYYAENDLKKELKNAMESGSYFLNSLLGTPLNVALDNSSIDTAGAILSQLKKRIIKNRYALETLTSVLCELNAMGFKGLDELYSECLMQIPRMAQKKLPESCSDSVSLPIVFYGLTMRINSDNFFDRQLADGTTKISFLTSTIRMNLEIGSDESIKFLESLLECSNTEIFKTKFIKTILNDKWKKIKWIPYLNGIIFVIYLISLSIFIVQNETIYLTIALVFNILTFLYEILQMKINFAKYWVDFWNYIDIVRAGFFYAYFYFICLEPKSDNTQIGQTSTDPKDDYYWILIIISILSSIRGITLFALSSSTRYMVSLLGEVIKDIIAFAVVVFYSILSFAFIKMAFSGPATSDGQGGINSLIIGAYFEAIGGGDSSESGFVLFLVIINSIFNVIIMMNLLISILAGTYEKVSNDAEVEDLKELTEMIIEAEYLYYHNRGIKKKTFLQVCEEYNPPEIVSELDLKKKYKTVKSEIVALRQRNGKLYKTCTEKFKFLTQKHSETQSKIDNSKKQVLKELKSSGIELKKEVQKNIKNDQKVKVAKEFKIAAKSFVCLNGHLLRIKEKDYNYCEICRKIIKDEATLSCDICKFSMCGPCVEFYYENLDIKTEITCNEKHMLLHIDDLNTYLGNNKTLTNLTCRFCNNIVISEAFCCIPCLFVLCIDCDETYKRGKDDKSNSLKCYKMHKLNWRHSELYKQSLRMDCSVCQVTRLGSGYFSCIECPHYECLSCIKRKLDTVNEKTSTEDKENKETNEEAKAMGAIDVGATEGAIEVGVTEGVIEVVPQTDE